MIDLEYANAYVEVLEILKYVKKEDYNKIPEEEINLFKANANKNYRFVYNPKKTLDEQNVSNRAKSIIAVLFCDYWATENQKEKLLAKERYDNIQAEKEKQEKYNSNNIFQSQKDLNKINEISIEKSTSLTTIKGESILKKFFKILKSILLRNK